ncbi:hypothetical protein PIB30_038506 [Stylosanthes scabra]|uniref:Aminotransferase-like plant mobile domain-containing protein n=1 Tax=Stylosanthes scabra TaxID=79078 RepID=A0ABU6TDR2_9FABA|nr:hypothetical protein [Stylosanthes scabra]
MANTTSHSFSVEVQVLPQIQGGPQVVSLPYRTDAVKAVLDRSILQDDHRVLWCSIVPLIYFGTIEWHQVDRVIPQFGGVQNTPHAPLNIDFMHAKDGRERDQWFPQKYQRWHDFWASKFAQLFEVAQSDDPDPFVDFLRWWYLAARRQPGRRMMVGMSTTARDWQWLDEMMGEDAPAERPTQKIRRMPKSYGRRRGGRGAVEAAETSRQADLPSTPQTQRTEIPSTLGSPSQTWLDGLSSLGFQQMLSDILIPVDGGYRPEFDGTQFDGSQVHIDLNEPVSGLLHAFMALSVTPPSAAHVPGGSWQVLFMALATVPAPPASSAPAE